MVRQIKIKFNETYWYFICQTFVDHIILISFIKKKRWWFLHHQWHICQVIYSIYVIKSYYSTCYNCSFIYAACDIIKLTCVDTLGAVAMLLTSAPRVIGSMPKQGKIKKKTVRTSDNFFGCERLSTWNLCLWNVFMTHGISILKCVIVLKIVMKKKRHIDVLFKCIIVIKYKIYNFIKQFH